MNYFWVGTVLLTGELLMALAFHLLKKRLGPADTGSSRGAPALKGMLERLTMLVGLLAGFPHVLTAFGALKISTRLSEDQDDHISNTYFLMGNMLSILFAMSYAWIIRTVTA